MPTKGAVLIPRVIARCEATSVLECGMSHGRPWAGWEGPSPRTPVV